MEIGYSSYGTGVIMDTIGHSYGTGVIMEVGYSS